MIARGLLLLAAATLMLSGCYDFSAPDFPGGGAAAVFQVNVILNENGTLGVTGLFAPGIDPDGFQRKVPRDTLELFGVKVEPSEVQENGTREYGFTTRIAPALTTQPLQLQAPPIEGFTTAPSVKWFALRRSDPDTIVWRRGTDLVLHLDTALGTSVPTPRIREWFLELRSTSSSFRLSSDGLPPTALRIPSEWVPPTVTSDIVAVTLSLHQSSRVEPVGANYLAVFDYTYLASWVVIVLET